MVYLLIQLFNGHNETDQALYCLLYWPMLTGDGFGSSHCKFRIYFWYVLSSAMLRNQCHPSYKWWLGAKLSNQVGAYVACMTCNINYLHCTCYFRGYSFILFNECRCCPNRPNNYSRHWYHTLQHTNPWWYSDECHAACKQEFALKRVSCCQPDHFNI